MQGHVTRQLHRALAESLLDFPAVAILGPRQAGKTTLAQEIVQSRPEAVYLDLERPSDLRKLSDPELFFQLVRSEQPQALVCLDEIQRVPELFPVLRSVIDETGRNGQFLLLGSASRDLLRQTSESLAGRIRFLELTPFLASELDPPDDPVALARFWLRGGFPRSYLARSDESSRQWRESFTRTFLERDIPQLGFNVPAATLLRLWGMLAHRHGQLLNASQLGGSLGLSHTTIRSHIDLLTQTFMVRLLAPLSANVEKRLVKYLPRSTCGMPESSMPCSRSTMSRACWRTPSAASRGKAWSSSRSSPSGRIGSRASTAPRPARKSISCSPEATGGSRSSARRPRLRLSAADSGPRSTTSRSTRPGSSHR